MTTKASVLIFFIIPIFCTESFGQDNPAGYLSIDCGSTVGRSTDPQTNLLWVDDGGYTIMGKNGLIQNPNWVNDSLIENGSGYYYPGNYQALKSFRYFPQDDMRSKYCYELPLTTSNISFLLRAMFLHGNATELSLPIDFTVYVNNTPWLDVTFVEDNDFQLWQNYSIQESIFFSPPGGGKTNVCLVPNQGVPFISSLELRQLDTEGGMYAKSFPGRTGDPYFTTLGRWYFGPDLDKDGVGDVTIRYPDDLYDRLWVPYTFYAYWVLFESEGLSAGDYSAGTFSKATQTVQEQSLGPDINSVPVKVMNGAWTGVAIDGDIGGFQVDLGGTPRMYLGSSTYSVLYCAILNETNVGKRIHVDIGADGDDLGTFHITTRPSQKSFLHDLNTNYSAYTFTGTLSMSAFEYFEQNNFIAPTTYSDDVRVVNLIKKVLNLTTWQGDPCVPVSYDWIGCELDYTRGSEWYVQNLTLSNFELLSTAAEELNNGESGWQLNYLSITNSKISSDTFKLLLQNFFDHTWLSTLNIASNGMEGELPQSLSRQYLPNSKVLDISNNSFNGTFPSNYYIMNTSDSFYLNADMNQFGNTLDLTIWHQNLAALSEVSKIHDLSTSTQSGPVFNQLFSFVNNSISSIKPSAEDFGPLIESLINITEFTQSGVLLGGNPYCKGAKDFTHRFLCRSSTSDVLYPYMKKKSKLVVIIPSVLGTALAIILIAFLTASVCLLQKKVKALKMVEQELASRRVQPPFYSFYDLKLATNNFSNEMQLGKGHFGAVFKGVLADGTTVAVKRLFTSNKKQVLNEFLNEVVLITGIKHKNLIQLKGCCIENEERILVYGYAENGSVEDALWGQQPKTVLSWRSRFKMCVGIASGLTYLHEELIPRIIHRDIKPANILLDKHLNPKIADFGLAKHFLEEVDVHVTQVIAGTRGYFAPEYISEGRLTNKIDVYSFGIVALEIVSGRKCYNSLLPSEELYLRSWAQKLQRSGEALKLLDPKLHADYDELEVLKVIDIALLCVNNDPELRPTMSQVETMLLEGHERVFDILSAAVLKKEDDDMDRIYKSLGRITGVGVWEGTQFSGWGSEGAGGSTSHKIRHSEDGCIVSRPLLSCERLESSTESPEQLTYADGTAEYDQNSPLLSCERLESSTEAPEQLTYADATAEYDQNSPLLSCERLESSTEAPEQLTYADATAEYDQHSAKHHPVNFP